MFDLNYLAIVVASVAALVVSTVWYAVFGARLAQARGGVSDRDKPAPWMIAVEFGRSFVVAAVFAGFARQMGIADLGGAVLLAVAAWVGFSLVMWVGAVMWEKEPWQLAAIHGGDWLVKSVVIAGIVGVWQ
jgi:hypothetical protein